jgi:hypothetical protein
VCSVVAVLLGLDGGVGDAFETELSICGSNHIGIRGHKPPDRWCEAGFFISPANICAIDDRCRITSGTRRIHEYHSIN